MPCSDFEKVAACLDNKRLGKQRVEAYQIYLVLQRIKQRDVLESYHPMEKFRTNRTIGWENHPIVKMWRGHEKYLAYYGWKICQEWKRRGFKDTMQQRFVELYGGFHDLQNHTPPNWIFDSELNISHQSNLIRKLPEHYTKFFPGVSADLPYRWFN